MNLPVTISVITPVYNGEQFVSDCIKSAFLSFGRGVIKIEHIIIDDGSSDSTIAAISDAVSELRKNSYDDWYGKAEYDCTVIPIMHTGKPSAARNVGLAHASGNYVFCLDVDDVLFRRSLFNLFQFAKTARCAQVYGNYLSCDSKLKYIMENDYWGTEFSTFESLANKLLSAEIFIPPTTLTSRSALLEIGGWDESITFGEDWDVTFRFGLKGNLPRYLEMPVLLKRNHDGNLTRFYTTIRSPIQKIELRSHYKKHRKAIEDLIPENRLREIKKFLEVEENPRLEDPPTLDVAKKLSGKN